MKNADYTCDLCHAQIRKSEVFVFDLGKMITTRTDPWTFFQYDLCEKCAKRVNDKVKQQFVTEVDNEHH